MAISIKHLFQSLKGDPGDATLVRPSNWNAEHVITAAANVLLGCVGAGAISEIACTAFGRGIIGAADAGAMSVAGVGTFTAGDVKLTLKTVADSGWVMFDDGTIGDGTSGASTRANADTLAAYTVIWAISNTYAPIFDLSGNPSSRGANATADFNAHKRLSLTKALGRTFGIAGAGSGLTARSLGQTLGEEAHVIAQAELPNVTLATTIAAGQGAHFHQGISNQGPGGVQAGGSPIPYPLGTQATSTATLPAMSGTTPLGGSGTAANVMQPTSFLNAMLKL